MTYTAKIGSIELQNAELYDNNTVDPEGTETFNVVCPNDQALQIIAYGGTIQKTSNGQARIITSQSSWGLLPLDMSVTLQNNEDITHRGVYAINTVTPSLDMGPDNVTLAVEAEYITDLNDYLYMRYWANQLDHGYTDTNPVNLLNETWATLNSSIWQSASIAHMTGASATVSSNQLVLTGAMTSAPGRIYVASQAKYTAPFTLTVPFTLPAAPSSSSGWESWMYLGNSASDESTGATVFRVGFTGNKSTIKFYVQQDIAKKGWTTLYSTTITTTTPSIQIQYNSDLSAQVWLNTGSGLVSKWVGKTQSLNSSVYLIFELNNWSSTSYTAKFGNLVVSGTANAKQPVAVGLPVSATLDTSPSFYRIGDSISIPVYDMTSAPVDLFYKTTIDNFFKGTVQAFSTNYSDSNPRQVTGFKQALDPTKFYVTNGLIKLVTDSAGVTLQYYDGITWQTMNYFGLGNINVIKPIYVSPFKFVLQLNKTYWTVEHGKRYVRVNHPYTDLSMSEFMEYDYINSGGTTSSILNPSIGVNVPLDWMYYVNSFTPAGNLLTANQSNVETDTTGLGVYGSTSSTGVTAAKDTANYWQGAASLMGYNGYTAIQSIYLRAGTSTSNYIPVIPGLTYTFSAYGKRQNAGTGSLRVYWYDKTGASLSNTTGNSSTMDSTWRRFTYSLTAPANARYAMFQLQCINAAVGEYAWYDGGQVEIGSSASTWVVGQGGSTKWRMQILRQNQQDILTDTIPAAELTGIGVYDSSITPNTAQDGYLYNAREFWQQIEQAIGVKQP